MERSYWQTNTIFVFPGSYIIADRDTLKSGFTVFSFLAGSTVHTHKQEMHAKKGVLHEIYFHWNSLTLTLTEAQTIEA